MKREKRIKKGIESLQEQIAVHEEKLEEVIKKGDRYLLDYYKKELQALKKRLQDRKSKLNRGDE